MSLPEPFPKRRVAAIRAARLLAALCALVLAPSGLHAQVRQTPCYRPLQCLALPLAHKGRFVVDASGEVRLFHGVNMIDKFPPYDPAVLGFGSADATILLRAGINLVRLGVIYAAVEPVPGTYDEHYLDRIAATVALLRGYGIFSLLDFHQDIFGPTFTGEGFPRWAAETDGLPTLPNYGFPDDYGEMPALQHAYDHFWNDSTAPDGLGLQEHYIRAWRHVAARFRNDQGVLGYDLFNEPFPGTDWQQCLPPGGCPQLDQSVLGPFMAKAARAIALVDPNHLVFYEPWVLFDAGAPTFASSPGGLQAGMSFHDYATGDFALPIRNALNQLHMTGDALLMTEFGASVDPAPVTEVANLADGAMLSWCYWTYANDTPFQIDSSSSGLPPTPEQQGIILDLSLPRTGDNVNQAVLNAISRPYPQVVAGIPQSFGFDPATGRFDLVYRAAGTGDRETDIAVPRAQYASGYRSRVVGGAVVSPPNAPILRIVAAPGTADTVHVTVAPR